MVITTPIKQRLAGIGGIYEFTMFELKPQTVFEFRSRADQYRCRQLGSMESESSDEHVEDLARKFWRRLGPTMEPSVYGADLAGSLFDDDKASGWNINQLSSCLRLLTADHPDGGLPGVTNSYLYFGMWASCFAA
jgi:jumonji domain-containing protein 2